MDKIVLICATGRSGSTTMQRIINIIPNSNICGENFGAVNSLLEFYKRKLTGTLISHNKETKIQMKPLKLLIRDSVINIQDRLNRQKV